MVIYTNLIIVVYWNIGPYVTSERDGRPPVRVRKAYALTRYLHKTGTVLAKSNRLSSRGGVGLFKRKCSLSRHKQHVNITGGRAGGLLYRALALVQLQMMECRLVGQQQRYLGRPVVVTVVVVVPAQGHGPDLRRRRRIVRRRLMVVLLLRVLTVDLHVLRLLRAAVEPVVSGGLLIVLVEQQVRRRCRAHEFGIGDAGRRRPDGVRDPVDGLLGRHCRRRWHQSAGLRQTTDQTR